ncbi:Os03g0197066 [Oryza sativa Japonica Group]|uniref:Os03g0197066 protein n=1 Tax=Oryza sativa subsp. japonica TaxID=39947 RepID=C7J0F0_ORYSJ|nr:Os03g0197066 [Oryza sativa Japonica Group]|eukprot:NP_001173301.1 Os03g0197066 [Oryza sativa Japonica Group]
MQDLCHGILSLVGHRPYCTSLGCAAIAVMQLEDDN